MEIKESSGTCEFHMNEEDLIEFEEDIASEFLKGNIRVPIHLSGNNELALLKIFKVVRDNDWVFATHRNHYHALLKGYPKKELKELILSGESMHIYNKDIKFFTSSIVAGIVPIALGVAMAIKKKGLSDRVWVFVGDMAFETGVYHECIKYAGRNDLPMTFIVEDNGLSTDTPTYVSWGIYPNDKVAIRYRYNRKYPHVGCGEWVTF